MNVNHTNNRARREGLAILLASLALLSCSGAITAELMKAFEGNFDRRIEALINGKIEGSRTSQNDEKLLGDTFKGFANPAMKPMIQGVFNKALEHSKGDRAKALDLAKGMLQAMGQHGKDDFGFSRFNNPDDNLAEGPSRLVQELLELRQ